MALAASRGPQAGGSQERSSQAVTAQKTSPDRTAWNRLPPVDVETELTFGVPASALERVGETVPVTHWSRNRGRTLRLESVYYDTADGLLKRNGLGLRGRRIGRRFIQTLKTENPHDPMKRGEWEVAVAGEEPDLSAFEAAAARDHLRPVDPGALAPVLVTRIRRHARILEIPAAPERGDGAAVVELALDDGAIDANGAVLPVSEIELELVRGDPAALYTLAELIHAEIPLRIEPQSKSARGWCLAEGAPPPWHKSSKTKVPGSAAVDGALDAILRDCRGHWLANHAVAVDGTRTRRRTPGARGAAALEVGAVGVHGCGRTRLSAGALRRGPLAGRRARRRARLGRARRGGFKPGGRHHGWRRWPRQLAGWPPGRHGSPGKSAPRMALRSPRATALVLKLGHWIESGGWRRDADEDRLATLSQPIRQFAIRRLNKAHRRVTRAGAGFENLSADDRHIVRLRLKRLRYLSEFFAQLYAPRRARRFVKALSSLQTSLGRRNDLVVADHRLRSLTNDHGDAQLATAAGIVVGWHSRSLADEEADLVGQWRRFAHAAPFWTQKR